MEDGLPGQHWDSQGRAVIAEAWITDRTQLLPGTSAEAKECEKEIMVLLQKFYRKPITEGVWEM